ncbi:cytochrome (ubi)quinol oxidase subunit III [Sphingomonas sp. ASV193]|uniref:cytochrome (ubi)quinol oxidase subunit III n=1 Tax=Sphingomonas sp. ASV193 TaxID=3144405 RepID=UPI0032E890CC
MSAASADPHAILGEPKPEGGTAPKGIVVSYGFWLFLVSDIILFSGFFAAYAVLSGNTDGGPSGRQLFHLDTTAIQTGCLLLSTFACGMASIAAEARSMRWTQVALLVTGLLGFVFVALELNEFVGMIAEGAGPQRSAFLSSFFALVGCHGLHVSAAILWCGTMMAQFWAKGFRDDIKRRMLCFALFWHALDIVWIGVFTVVYLLGARG